MSENFLAPLIPIVAIIGGLSMGAYSMYLRMKARQLMHEERLKMIERGIAPPPLSTTEVEPWPRRQRSPRSAGVFFISLGLGLGLLIGLSDEGMGKAIGVGGLFVLMGVGLLVNAMLDRREAAKAGPTGPATEVEPPRTPY